MVELLRTAERPLIVAGGGVLYSEATEALEAFATRHGVPVAETQAGKSAIPWDHPQAVGSIGVTGSSAANTLAREADLILGVGTRLQDFTTGSRALAAGRRRRWSSSTSSTFDSGKHGAVPLVGDARRTLEDLSQGAGRSRRILRPGRRGRRRWWPNGTPPSTRSPPPSNLELPTDAQVVGAVNRAAGDDGVVVCAAGGLPGELHKLWRARRPNGYHMEYGFSCMGYEIAGGLGVKMALPDREVFVMVGDGSYMMLNSELQTSVMLGRKLIVTVLDNRGYGCINRLQQVCGGAEFNNLIRDVDHKASDAWIDFAAHARSLGAEAEKVSGIGDLELALERAKAADRTYVVVIDTDPVPTTEEGGAWWDVAVPEVSERAQVSEAHEAYLKAAPRRRRLRRSGGRTHDGQAGHPPDRLDQRRHAGARRRHAARDLPRRRRGRPGFVGIEKGGKFPHDAERAPGRARPARARAHLGLVQRRAAPPLGRGRDPGDAAASSTCSRPAAARSWSSPRPRHGAGPARRAGRRPAADGRGRVAGLPREARPARRLDGRARAWRCPSTTTWAR